MLKDRLEALLGKNINQICPNNFHAADENHCAHFISHVMNIQTPFNCRQYRGGNSTPGNIRVHEVFPLCPKVGLDSDMDAERDQLVFITLAQNVNIAAKTMVNIPQKHVGIYCDGNVYHYSNGGDRVIKESIGSFKNKFQQTYSGHQGLFFGFFPGEAVTVDVELDGHNVSADIAFALSKTGTRWFARKVGDAASAQFLVGKETKNRAAGYYGLFVPVSEYYGPEYKGRDYEARFGHYAYLLELSGHCESKNRFNLINTYDRAKFTFGFYQLAAHTPDDNLILLVRDSIEAGVTDPYFPELKMINGRVHRVARDGGQTNLEQVFATGPNGDAQLQLFMNYLNPNRWALDEQEVLHAARFMHMANTAARSREIQAERAAEILERKMARYGARYELDGKSDVLCALVADIHHQGRASRARVKAALASGAPERNLIDINSNYASRAADLRHIIQRLRDEGHLGTKRYKAASNDFA